MRLFSFKTTANKKCECGNEEGINNEVSLDTNISSVKVLGSGCKKCNELEESTQQALKQLNINVEIEHVKDYVDIAKYGVMSTPALVINETVVSYGKVLKKDEVNNIIKKSLKV